MKRYLMSLTLREMEINITMRDQLTSIRMTVTKKQKITSVGDDVRKVGLMCIAVGNVKWNSLSGKWDTSYSK